MLGSEPAGTEIFKLYPAQGSGFLTAVSNDPMGTNQPNNNIVDRIIAFLSTGGTGQVVIGTVITAVVTSIAILLSGFGAIYIIPVIILIAVVNLFLPSLAYITTGMPTLLAIPLTLFLNLLLFLAIVNFIRGGI
jgi:hypothetical protein